MPPNIGNNKPGEGKDDGESKGMMIGKGKAYTPEDYQCGKTEDIKDGESSKNGKDSPVLPVVRTICQLTPL